VGIKERVEFLRAFLGDRKRVGAITPTSARMSRAMATAAETSRRKYVAELGAGTGPVTAALLEQLPPGGRLWAFEIRADFARKLRERFDDPRLTIVEGSATEAPKVAREAGLPGFDAVVSAIPFAVLGHDLTREILVTSAEAMAPGAPFVAIQYRPDYLPPFLRERFGGYEREFHVWNLPPAFIMRARA
jgi:phosphatidylethanolamine/phosphatidyl-N-methylethanolamine N-methyltransferase